MIGKRVILALGNDGIIVNVARGAVINEKELVDCLLKGEIAGAGLDVFENEPDVPEEFFQLDNVVMTPHRAVMTEESLKDLYELVVRNLDAFFTNKPLMFEVITVFGGSRFLEMDSFVELQPKRRKVFNSFALSYSSARLCVFQSDLFIRPGKEYRDNIQGYVSAATGNFIQGNP
nr:glyoxylate/hydroxypyruvate reductase HPR3-like [Tanacetum cinerariifolium]